MKLAALHCVMTMRQALLYFCLVSPISAAAQCEGTEVVFTSSTGQWGQEMAWELYLIGGGDTSLVADFQGEGAFAAVTDTLCLEDGCYTLLATDSWGDGWNGGGVVPEVLDPAVTLEGFGPEFTLFDGFYGLHTFSVGDGVLEAVELGDVAPLAS